MIIRRFIAWLSILFVLAVLLYFFSTPLLTLAGRWLVQDEKPERSDAVVVLSAGVEYYPRLMEAARLYREGHVRKVVINGNRKTDVVRDLEHRGYEACCPWFENSVRILETLGVPRKEIVTVSAEDAYDTVSEAKAVGRALIREGFRSVVITTSKSHTRRAVFIWRKMFENRLTVKVVPTRTDPFNPSGWWKDGRQIRWVLAEYGAWVYYWWKELFGL